MAKKEKKIKKKNRNRNNSLTKRIVNLTVFLDTLFLVIVLSMAIFVYLYSSNQLRDLDAASQNEIVLETLDEIFSDVESDVNNLVDDDIIIDYLKYMNLGICLQLF